MTCKNVMINRVFSFISYQCFYTFFLLYCVCSNDERDHMLVTSNPPVAALRTHVPGGVSPLSGEDA